MRDIDKISEKVEKRKTQLQPLFDKDKENYDLWAGKEQIFDTHKMSINITGGEMVALSRRTQASIVRSRIDIRVLPPNPLPNSDAKDTANREEDMYYFGLEQADERLANKGEDSLLSSSSWDVTNLGRVPVRVLVYYDKDEKKVIWDILPMIPSLVTFDFDDKGLVWYAYETFRSPSSILREYGKEVIEDSQGKGISVTDYWDRDDNVTYLTKSKESLGKVRKLPVKGKVPAIIQPVAGAPKVVTTEGINVAMWGQSIFDHVKTMFRNLNKLRSVAATHAHLIAKAPLDVPYEGEKPNLEAEHFDYYPGAVLEHPNTYTIGPLKIADIPASLPAMMGDIKTSIQSATFADLNPDKPAHSGAALRILGQDKQDVLTPRMEALNIMYTRICKMAKEQIIAQELTIPVKTVSDGVYGVYDMKPDLLENDFYVNAVLVSQDVYDDIEALQSAQVYQDNRWMSRESIMEKHLRIQDVPAEMEKMDMDEVEAGVPEMKLRRMIKRLVDRYDSLMEQGIEDKDLAEKIKQMEEQLFLLEAQKRQAVTGAMGQPPQGTPQGAPTRPQGVP